MARGVNKVILIGNLGQDPEVKYLPNGNAVANVSIATSDSWKDKQTGQPQERTEWHRVVFFGRLAEIAGEYLRKGSKVYIEGALRTRKWQGQDGSDRYTTEIVVDMNGQMQMLDGRADAGMNSGGYQQQPAAQSNQPNQPMNQAGGPAAGQQGQPARAPRQAPAPAPAPAQPPQGFDNFDDDIPF